jgi:hypothetical protein
VCGDKDLPDERRVHDCGDNADSDSLLLGRLSACRSAPTQNERVDTICANGEDDHGRVAACYANGCAGNQETDSGYALGDGDMPCAFVELAGRPGDGNGDYAGDEVGWACQDERDELGEA